MTLEECYCALHGNLDSVKRRLMNENLVDRFIRKFPNDPSMQQFRDAVAEGNRETAFVAVHTLKGVAANLSFTELQQAASCLTEYLRDLKHDPDDALLNQLENSYQLVMHTLHTYINENT